MRFTKKKITAAVAAVTVIALGGGAAYAYWTSSGNGPTAGTTGTSTAFAVAGLGVTAGLPLTPGGPSQTISFTVTNPSTGVQFLTAAVVTVANSNGSAWTAGGLCTAADYTVGTVSMSGGFGEIAAGALKTGTVTLAMNNLPASQDACKTVAVPLYISAT